MVHDILAYDWLEKHNNNNIEEENDNSNDGGYNFQLAQKVGKSEH